MTRLSTSSGRSVRPATPDDWERIARLRTVAFDWAGDPGLLPGMLVLEEAGTILACARLEAEAQWIGGRSVPTGLVSSVAVAPAARGRGVGTDLLRALLRDAREAGLSRLALYPSAIRPYRRVGFEIAGVAVSHTVRAAQLPRAQDGHVVDEMLPADVAAVTACYDRVAATRTGAIARSRDWWQTRVLAAATPAPYPPSELHGFVVRHGATVSGYVLYTQRAGETAYSTRITCRDLVWETAEAGRALLGLLGSGHPMTTSVSWLGEAIDPAGFLIDDAPDATSVEPWMVRVLDPVAALGAHGTLPDARAELTLHIVDAFEPDWSIGVRIRVADGRAVAEPLEGDGRAEPQAATIDVGALAALLAGGLQPDVAVATGRLLPGGLGLAPFAALLPPGRPWIGDHF